MAFRVKNLMIQVLPEAGEKSQQKLADFEFCFTTNFPTTPLCEVQDPAVLATLKEHLQEALRAMEEGESVSNEPNRIETPEQAEELENYLTTALEEVRQQKQTLQNKADKGQG